MKVFFLLSDEQFRIEETNYMSNKKGKKVLKYEYRDF